MATDGLSLYASLLELQSLMDARIDKVQQPDKDMLLLHLHGSQCGRIKLMLNIHNENGRIQPTQQVFDNPDVAPAFCMLLRKHLIGARITDISQSRMDRIAVFSLRGKDELQDETSMKLIIELMGRHGNIFLIDGEGIILDCMRHFGIHEDSVRICLPNCIYEEPPKQERLHPFEVTEEQLFDAANGNPPPFWLGNTVLGISKLCSQQICSDGAEPRIAAKECFDVFSDLKSGKIFPSVLQGRGVLPFVPKNAPYLSFPTMWEAQEAFYRMRDEQAVMTRQRTALRSTVEHVYKRIGRALESCMLQIGDATAAECDRRYGELLVSNIGTLKTIGNAAVVWDYYADPPAEVTVPLDPKFSIQQNAQRYFKRYRKAKTAQEYAASRIGTLTEERDYLEGLLLAVEQCSSAAELDELWEELTVQGYRKDDGEKRRKAPRKKSEPLCYLAPDGTTIRVGKNNRQNDLLFKTEPPDYYWLHAKDTAASHVYIESEQPSSETLQLAAEIAAYHSKASGSAQVPVDYTLHRYVKKPSGARPGFVHYFHQHTVYVTPHAERLLPLRTDGKERIL